VLTRKRKIAQFASHTPVLMVDETGDRRFSCLEQAERRGNLRASLCPRTSSSALPRNAATSVIDMPRASASVKKNKSAFGHVSPQ
jgi:hypothetical protein